MVDLIINSGSQTLDGTHTYDNVSITNGGILYVTPYNGTGTTGTLILNVTYNVYVDATSSINGNSRGYRGGAKPGGCGGGIGGEIQGNGGGGNGTFSCSYSSGGGGGGYGGAGADGGGPGWYPGIGGSTKGTANGLDIDMGSGGGSGGADGAGNAGAGESGGAKIQINATTMTVRGTITSNGGSGGWCNSGHGSGSGASGGGILLNTTGLLDISGAIITANGGPAGSCSVCAPGGSGGGGRIKFFYGSLSNTGTTVSVTGNNVGSIYYETVITTGSASFTSSPTGARIWIDGVDKGVNTPNTISDLSAGNHNYTLKLTGYIDSNGSFPITAGQTTIISVNLLSNITATNIEITPGPYAFPIDLTINVTWVNNGNITYSFEPAIKITRYSDGAIIRMNMTETTINPAQFITRSFNVPNLVIDIYAICPDPN